MLWTKKPDTTECWFSGKIDREAFAMQTSKFTDEQIAFTPKQVEPWTPVKEVICKVGITGILFIRPDRSSTARLSFFSLDVQLVNL